MTVAALATAVGIGGAAIGVWLTGARERARVVAPFSAGVLLAVALFGLAPELALESGWRVTVLLFTAGYLLLFGINKFAYPVCPTCAHDHDHTACATELHGFAFPLIAAAALHSAMDGWSVATTQLAAPLGLRVAVPLAVALHKIPEGVALGGILRASVKQSAGALGWSVAAEGATLLGGAAGLWMAPQLGSGWTAYPVGLTAGWLFYLGYHAVHEEWQRRGAVPALLAAGAGAVCGTLIQRGAEALLR
jgi:zinc transporter ZupT